MRTFKKCVAVPQQNELKAQGGEQIGSGEIGHDPETKRHLRYGIDWERTVDTKPVGLGSYHEVTFTKDIFQGCGEFVREEVLMASMQCCGMTVDVHEAAERGLFIMVIALSHPGSPPRQAGLMSEIMDVHRRQTWQPRITKAINIAIQVVGSTLFVLDFFVPCSLSFLSMYYQ